MTDSNARDAFRQLHALFGGLLAARREPEALIEAVAGRAFDLFEDNIDRLTRDLPPLACRKGCPSCCILRVTATAPEIFLLADYVRRVDATPQGAALGLPRRIAHADRVTKGLAEAERMALRKSCPFIVHGVCIVHPVRPLACRGHASFDRKACAGAAAGRDVDVPVSEPHFNLRGLVQSALQSALRSAGLAWGLYEMNHALMVALGRKEALLAWLDGQDSLGPMVPEFDMGAAATRFAELGIR